MGFFDFFKKIIQEEKTEEKEKVVFSELGNWIKKKTSENETKEKRVLDLIHSKIIIFANELEGKINVLKNVDVEAKKAEDKFKPITNEGREKYVEFVENLIRHLKDLENENLEQVIEKVNKVFSGFGKSSHMSYERATVLIGKEISDIKESLKVFSKDLIKTFDENKDVVELCKTLSNLKLKLKEITKIDEELKNINEAMNGLNKEIKEKEEEKDKVLEEIEKIKKSEEYLKNSENIKKVKLLEEELEKDILGLRQLIDFKALASFFHIFGEQMNAIKSHRENFKENFQKDGGKSILGLLNESKLNNETITEKIKDIDNKKEKIEKTKQEIKGDETQELYSEITKMILEIGSLKNEKVRLEKQEEKLKINREELIEMVKGEVGGVGGEFVDVF